MDKERQIGEKHSPLLRGGGGRACKDTRSLAAFPRSHEGGSFPPRGPRNTRATCVLMLGGF